MPALLLCSCSGSKVLPAESLHMDAATTRDYPSRFYDDHTRIRYDFRNDDQYLYVILETDNPTARMRMLREGVKIYFPPAGSKSETRFVEYPFHTGGGPAAGPQKPKASTRMDQQREMPEQPAGDRDYTFFYKQARFTNNGKTALLDPADNAPGTIHFKAANEPDGFFRYIVSIPKSQLMISKNRTIIGIRVPEMKRQGNTYPGHDEPSTRMSAGGRRGGHAGGGGMRGGGMHNRGAGAEGMNHNQEDAGGKIDWWYKITWNS